MRALLIDDSALFLDTLTELAGAAGLEVVGKATSGVEGCRLHDALRPDVVLVDVQMAGMTGYQVAEHIRNTRPETHVVLISANPSAFGSVLAKQSLTPQTLASLVEDLSGSEAIG